MADKAVSEYRRRRAERLAARGAKLIYTCRVNMDAPGEEKEGQNNNQRRGGKSKSSSGGSHGNTKLPFGLCKRFGIEIEAGWTPKDAWDALRDKGITPEGAYAKLKRGEDPGTPDDGAGIAEKVEPPREPVRTVMAYGKEYGELSSSYASWDKKDPYRLTGKSEDGRTIWMRFHTKKDMLYFLKKNGCEEFMDPDTGEVLDLAKMEMPEVILDVPNDRAYTELTIGLRGGRYCVIGTDLDGKKKTIWDFGSLASAKEKLMSEGVNADDVKLSPSLKKREKERVAWLTSDKKEYFEVDGKRYGDITITSGWSGYSVVGEDEDGQKHTEKFPTKTDAIKWLKDRGVQKVKIDKEAVDPQEVEIPEPVAVIGKKGYKELGIGLTRYGSFYFYGVDLDGRKAEIGTKMYASETYQQYLDGIKKSYGIDPSQLTIDDEVQAAIDKRIKADEEKARRRREFEEKAVTIGYGKYVDPEIVADYDGFRLIGYDENGDKKSISARGDWLELVETCQNTFHIDPADYIKDPAVKEAYDRHKIAVRRFEDESVDICGGKYANIEISYSGDMYKVYGSDIRGRRREIHRASSSEGLSGELKRYGFDVRDFPMDDAAKQHEERVKKVKKALETGGYYACGKKEEAYTDVRAVRSAGMWRIKGKDVDGEETVLSTCSTWDEAVTSLEGWDVKEYSMTDRDSGKAFKRPTYGMHGVMLMRTESGGYAVYADTKRFGSHRMMYEGTSEEECRKWLRNNNVEDGGVKTRGMNPNDTVPRTHTAKSLASFDSYRMAKVEKSYVKDLTSDEKTETAEMLTEMFSKGAYRVTRSTDSFLGILEKGYLSQMETGTGGSGACLSKSFRGKASEILYGHSGLEGHDYEKYGYLGLADDAADFSDRGSADYGKHGNSMTYTLRKNTMKDRVTYTLGDSLNRDMFISSAGYAGEHPTIEGITALRDASDMRDLLETYRQYKNGKKTYQEFFHDIRRQMNNNYLEVQYHGDVTAADIEQVAFGTEIEIERAFSRMSNEKRKKAISILSENGIKIIYRGSKSEPFKDGWEWLRRKYPSDIPA